MTAPRFRVCPVCRSDDLVAIAHGVDRCRECGLGLRQRAAPPPASAAPGVARRAALVAARGPVFRRGLARVFREVGGGRLLDVGAGTGDFVEAAIEGGWRAVGLDHSAALLGAGRRRSPPLARGTATALPVLAGSFDAVTYWDVVDYLDEPVKALGEGFGALRPGGVVLVRVRNGPVHLALRRLPLLSGSAVLHTLLFSGGSLGRALEEAGFEDVRVCSAGLTRGDPYGTAPALLRPAVAGVKRTWEGIAAVVSGASGSRWQVGPSLLAVARRPDPGGLDTSPAATRCHPGPAGGRPT